MEESIFKQPSSKQLEAFIAGDPVAEDEVLRLVLPQLYRWAKRHYSNLPDDEVQSEINRVVLETCRPRVRYNPNAGTNLTTYLINLIKLRLNTLYQNRKQIKDSEISESDAPEKWLGLPYKRLENDIRITRDTFFQEISLLLHEPEREFLELMRQGEKRQDVFITVLERYGTVSDPAREVKNMKERLLRKLRTFAEEHGYQLQDILSD